MIRIQSVLSILVIASMLGFGAAAVAEAKQPQFSSGQRTYSGHHYRAYGQRYKVYGHRHSHGHRAVRLGGQRTYAKVLRVPAKRFALDGRYPHFKPGIYRHSNRQAYHAPRIYSRSQIAIVVGAAAAAQEPVAVRDGVILEGGSCAPGEYCTLRLGSGLTAPKIITLNRSGSTITCTTQDCAPLN